MPADWRIVVKHSFDNSPVGDNDLSGMSDTDPATQE